MTPPQFSHHTDRTGRSGRSQKFSSTIPHAQYLPYCDVYRCDAFAYTYLNKPAKRVGTHLIPSHHELHLAIESQLNKHNATKEGRAVE